MEETEEETEEETVVRLTPGASRAGGGASATSQLHTHLPACPGFSTNTEGGQTAEEPSSEQHPALHTTCAEAVYVAQKDAGQSSGQAPSSADFQSKLKPQGCECRRSPRSRPGGESPVPRGQGLPFLPLPIPALPDQIGRASCRERVSSPV